jgi:hypothetical protein
MPIKFAQIDNPSAEKAGRTKIFWFGFWRRNDPKFTPFAVVYGKNRIPMRFHHRNHPQTSPQTIHKPSINYPQKLVVMS